MHRRRFLGTSLAAGLACAPASGRSRAATEPSGGSLDRALERLHATDPEFGGGLSNHGPMAAEALEAMGHPGRIVAFVDRYARRLAPMSAAIPLDAWRDAVGRPELRAAMIAAFVARDDDPAQMIRDAIDVLAPGLVGAAFHGLLRTADAYRGWQRQPSAVRRTELAHGLGYWAARHQRLPGEPGRRAQAGLGPAQLLAAVEFVRAPQAGLILDHFAVLEQRPEFAALIDAFDPDACEVDVALDQLVSAAARGYLAASDAGRRFVYLHGITSTAAVRNLLPALEPAQRKLVVAHQVAAIAAVHATHGEAALPEPARATGEVDWAELARRASVSADDHTIKLVEACVSEARRGAVPELAVVARDRLGG